MSDPIFSPTKIVKNKGKEGNVEIRKSWKGMFNGLDLSLYLSCQSETLSRGKFLVGQPDASKNAVLIVYDDAVEMHKELAEKYQMRPRGGGWMSIDLVQKRVHIGGTSEAYGRELDRRMTFRAIGAALPDFACTVDI